MYKRQIQTIAANPENGKDVTVAAPTTKKETEGSQSKGPGSGGSPSSEVASATRNAVVAYAKQFLGNPYVYGGTSLTSGADCSGFTQSVFAHFGISTGRSSRDQAARDVYKRQAMSLPDCGSSRLQQRDCALPFSWE